MLMLSTVMTEVGASMFAAAFALIHMPCNCNRVDVEEPHQVHCCIDTDSQSHDSKALPGHQKTISMVDVVSSVTHDDLSCHQYTVTGKDPQH